MSISIYLTLCHYITIFRELNEIAALSARETRVITGHGIQVPSQEAPLTTESILMTYVRDTTQNRDDNGDRDRSNGLNYNYMGDSRGDSRVSGDLDSVTSNSNNSNISDGDSYQSCDDSDSRDSNEFVVETNTNYNTSTNSNSNTNRSARGTARDTEPSIASYHKAKASIKRVVGRLV